MATAGLGLQPLPTPQQVTQAVQQGRVDPFSDPRPPAPKPSPAATAAIANAVTAPASGTAPRTPGAPGVPARPAEPAVPALHLSGVIQSGGRPEAIVVLGSQSDSLRIGQSGSPSTPLLPPGWSVESININACSLVLKKGSRVQHYGCASS